MLYHALQAGESVVLHNVATTNFYLFKKGQPVRVGGRNPPELSEPTLFLHDAATSGDATFSSLYKRIIVFSCPNRYNYVDLEKCRNTRLLHMPTWSWKEMKHAARHLGVPIHIARELFGTHRGIPRYVLETKQWAMEQNFKALQAAVSHYTLRMLNNFGEEGTEQESHKIMHRTLKKNDDNTPNYSSYQLRFASRYVSAKVLSFLHTLQDTPHLASVQENLFEKTRHLIAQKGWTVHMPPKSGGV